MQRIFKHSFVYVFLVLAVLVAGMQFNFLKIFRTNIASIFSPSRAILQINPSVATVSPNQEFQVDVVVSVYGEQSLNVVSGEVHFPNDLLEVVDVVASSSLIPLWVRMPSQDTEKGIVTFEGGVPFPGFSGINGKVISIVFKAKAVGDAQMVFKNSHILANDGNGTDIAGSHEGALIQIKAPGEMSGRNPDLNEDGNTNMTDVSILLSAFGQKNATLDLTGDGHVSLQDFSILLSSLGLKKN